VFGGAQVGWKLRGTVERHDVIDPDRRELITWDRSNIVFPDSMGK
jgi:hypothetical protein